MEIKKLLEEFDEDIIRAFLQKNADYYLLQWKLMAKLNKKISWNWAAFLFTHLWLLYRKMYFYFFVFAVINLLSIIPIVGLFIAIAISVGVGIYGNYLYGKFTYRKLLKLKLAVGDDKEALKLLAMHVGGTSILAVSIALILYLMLLIFIGYSAESYEVW